MIAYVMLGTNDIEKSAEFYNALLATIGAGRAPDPDGNKLNAFCMPEEG